MAARGQLELLQISPSPRGGQKGEVERLEPVVRAVRAKDQARLLAEARAPKLRLGYARAFCAAVLATYWQKLQPRCRHTLREAPSTVTTPLKGEGVVAAQELAEVAALLPIDDASYLVGRTYAAMLPDDFRSTNGVFYTPPAIVDRLLDSVTTSGIDWANCRALDPACGGGAFLGPVARRMVASLKGSDKRVALRNLSARLKGYEIDPFAAWLSAVFLDATLNEELGFPGDEAFNAIDVCDSLTRSFESAEFELVIGNPPYGRVGLSEDLRTTFQRSLYGHANLYGVFLDLALRKVKEGGVIAYVTPTGFLSGHYFKNLRSLLAEKAPPIVLDFISQREGVFDDVIQETILAVFRRGAGTTAPKVNFVELDARNRLTISSTDQIPLPANVEQPWIVPRTPDATDFVKRLRAMSWRLANWGYGVSTGPLVWNRFKKQLRDEPEPGAVPLIWAESVSADGEFGFRAARRNHSPYFAVAPGDDALLVQKSCVLLQRTTAKEQPRRLIAAELPQAFIDEHGGTVIVENHLNMVVDLVPQPPVSTKALAAFLNSSTADRAFRCISGTVAVSAYELESMPLPAPWAMKGLDQLLAKPHSKADVDDYCQRLYGDR